MNKTIYNFESVPHRNFSYVGNRSIYPDIPLHEVVNGEFLGYSQRLLNFGGACVILFCILGVTGNFISILALSRCRNIRNATTAFIVNLCVSDLLFSSFIMPLTAQVLLSRTWFSNDSLCKFYAFIRFSIPMVSMFTVLAITINRYILIVHPQIYPFLYQKRPMAVMIAAVWLFPMMLLLLPLSGIWGKLGHNPNGGSCSILKLNGKSPKTFIYIIGLLLPSFTFIACYVAIYYVVKKIENKSNVKVTDTCFKFFKRRNTSPQDATTECVEQQNQTRQHNRKRFRLVRIMLVIFSLFTICYFPMFIAKFFRKGQSLPGLHILSYICYFFSSVINPVIYVAMSKEYRKAYKNLFGF